MSLHYLIITKFLFAFLSIHTSELIKENGGGGAGFIKQSLISIMAKVYGTWNARERGTILFFFQLSGLAFA